LVENDYDYEDDESVESTEYSSPAVSTQENIDAINEPVLETIDSGLSDNAYDYESEPKINDSNSDTQTQPETSSSNENFGLVENDYDYEDDESVESTEYSSPTVSNQENIDDGIIEPAMATIETGLSDNAYDYDAEPETNYSNSETQTQSETSSLNENLGLIENDYDYSDIESQDNKESSEPDTLVASTQENIDSGIDNTASDIGEMGLSETAYDYGLEPEIKNSENDTPNQTQSKEQKAPERQDPVTNQNISQDSPVQEPIPESEKTNVVSLSSTDIMSCQTNRHVVELITSFLTGGQDNKEHPSSMSYGEYTSKFGTDGFDPSLLPEISAHKDNDKTALLEFNFLQLLQNYLLTEKAGDSKKYPLDDAPAPFAKVMCLLMAEDMANREYLGDTRTINCPNGTCQTTWFITPIWGFGCWCNFGQALMSGTGQPVHRADTICRDMQLCLRCAKKDAKNRGEYCDPVTQTYNFTATAGGFEADCTASNNGDLCAVDTCCCEQQFLSDLLAEVFNPGWVYDASFKHDHGFSVEDNCPFGNDRQESDCCGKKPRRFPYNSTKRDCCKEVNVFNPINQVCCSDGSVVSSTNSC